MDFFIVNVALPSVNADLGVSSSMLELVVAAYVVTYALLLVLGGRLGDLFGRRRLFLAGTAAFTVTSVACGLAGSAEQLVAARVGQGAAAALTVPRALATIQAATTGHSRARAIGLYAATAGAAASLGQVVGGVLATADIAGTAWRPIFLVNVPIGGRRARLGRRARAGKPLRPAGEHRPGRHRPARRRRCGVARAVDRRADARLADVELADARHRTHSSRTDGNTVPAARTNRCRPLVPPSMLRVPGMRLGLAMGLPFFLGFGGFMFVFALTVQQGLGRPA